MVKSMLNMINKVGDFSFEIKFTKEKGRYIHYKLEIKFALKFSIGKGRVLIKFLNLFVQG